MVIGGDAVVNFGGAAASMTDAAPAVPLTIASVSALPTDTTEPSPEAALFSGLLGAAALTAHPGREAPLSAAARLAADETLSELEVRPQPLEDAVLALTARTTLENAA